MTQELALKILKTDKNVFLTGAAGSGKTYILNKYIEYLKENNIPMAITASTGISSTHINGITIHSWSGANIKDHITISDIKKIEKNKQKKDRIEQVKVLIIDEISMLSKKTLEIVDIILQNIRNNFNPFGGIKVVFLGDFFQLPPVSKENLGVEKFSFMSKSWVNLNLKICYLTTQYRQNQGILIDILDEVRSGTISENSIKLLKNKIENYVENEDELKLYTHNIDVDKKNDEELKKIKEKEKIFKAKTKGAKNLVEILEKSILTQNNLKLKLGAKVMFIKNNYNRGYINGTMGEIIDFDEENIPLVETINGDHIYVRDEKWSINDISGKELASFIQLPLRLAWAITIHKSQGMTLDRAEVDLSKTFEDGQGYVAISRLRNWESLNLKGINQKSLDISPIIFKVDRRFKELSQEVEKEYKYLSEEEIKQQHTDFIKNNSIKKD